MRSMKLLDVLCAPWAIQPDKLREIQAIYATHLRGEKIDLAAVEKRLGRPLANEPAGYEVVDGVAVVPLQGPSAKRANMLMQVSGGFSTELAARDLRAAGADPAAHSVLLRIDSPGGTVDGTQVLAQIIRDIAAVKPVVALAGGTMASAAYWYGSAASRVYIEDGTTQVGSIGVVATHTDVSGYEAQQGFKTTEVYAGKYKRIASQYRPLSTEGQQSIQDQVDAIYAVFVDAVAQQRGVSVERVLADMADGRIFIGEQAVRAGLVDGVSTFEGLIAQLNRDRSNPGAGVALRVQLTQPTPGAHSMTITRDQLQAQAPDLLQSLLAEGRATGLAEGRATTQADAHAAGAAAERQRIQDVQAQAMPGHQALIQRLAFDGTTTGPMAAVAVLQAERAARGHAAQQLADDAPAPVQPAATPAAPAAPDAQEAAMPVEDRCKARWERNADSVRSEFTSLGAYTAYTVANEQGRARLLRK
jgi:signal peptide peptidase SppA